MDELVDGATRAKYGEHPVAKRVASATSQTVGVGLGMQELSKRLFRKAFGTEASPDQVLRAHRSGLRIAMAWADFNQYQLTSVEGKIRTLRNDHGGIEPLHAEGSFAIEPDGTLSFVDAGVLDAVLAERPEPGNGRFGCPGKKFIPRLWEWTEDVSNEHGLTRGA
jgi:hypothetical protein